MDKQPPTIAKTFWILHQEMTAAQTMIAKGLVGFEVDERLSILWRLQDKLERRAADAPEEYKEVLADLCRYTRNRLEATEQSLSHVSTLH